MTIYYLRFFRYRSPLNREHLPVLVLSAGIETVITDETAATSKEMIMVFLRSYL